MRLSEFEKTANSYGFDKAFALVPAPLKEEWYRITGGNPPEAPRLCLDPSADYPWASSVVLLIRSYRPFRKETGLPAYYIASNAGYHAAADLSAELERSGYRAKLFEPPLAALVTSNDIGSLLKNSLIDIPPFGTRTVLFAIVTNGVTPDGVTPNGATPGTAAATNSGTHACGDCSACADACTSGAIDPYYGLDRTKCIRTYMDDAVMPDWVRLKLPGLLGCEICQSVCPRNFGTAPIEPTDSVKAAFDLTALANGDIKAACALVGKNMCTRGRLQAQAKALLEK